MQKGRVNMRDAAPATPSPLNGERAGVRGGNVTARGSCLSRKPHHPSPSIPLPVEGRGRSAARRLLCVLLITASCAGAATISENFSADPRARGWKNFGDTNLVRWNATNQNLDVTWDSSRTNSFFQLPLGTIVSKNDDFAFAFDLRMRDLAIGTSAGKPDTFEIALGLINSVNSTNPNYFRGTGQSAAYGVKNSVEFDYFPPTAVISATFAPTIISSNALVSFSDNHDGVELTTNDLFHIAMSYTASNRVLRTAITRNGLPYGAPPNNTIKDMTLDSARDFRVDRLAIINYSDALQVGQTQYWGSIRAHGTVDNLVVTVPDAPVGNFSGVKSNSTWRATFTTKTNWFYALERSADFATWTAASPTNSGTGTTMLLQDTNAAASAFYRVKAARP